MRHGIIFSIIVALSAVSAPLNAQANVCGKFETTGCGVEGHKVLIQVPAIVKGAHTECMACSGEFPSDCHDDCPESFGFGPMGQAAFKTILASADEGDVGAVLALSREVRGIVFYNKQRSAVQILDCSGSSVIASLQVSDIAMQQIAERSLPSTVAMDVSRRQLVGSNE